MKEAIFGSVGRIQSISRSATAAAAAGEVADFSFVRTLIREFEISRKGQIDYRVETTDKLSVSIRQTSLIRIVQNLVANATEAAQVKIVTLRGHPQNHTYVLQVENDGETIPLLF